MQSAVTANPPAIGKSKSTWWHHCHCRTSEPRTSEVNANSVCMFMSSTDSCHKSLLARILRVLAIYHRTPACNMSCACCASMREYVLCEYEQERLAAETDEQRDARLESMKKPHTWANHEQSQSYLLDGDNKDGHLMATVAGLLLESLLCLRSCSHARHASCFQLSQFMSILHGVSHLSANTFCFVIAHT